jgi:hypothetical protein
MTGKTQRAAPSIATFPAHRRRGVKVAVLRLTNMRPALVESELLNNPKQLPFLAKIS